MKKSAGTLLYRQGPAGLEVLLFHPSGNSCRSPRENPNLEIRNQFEFRNQKFETRRAWKFQISIFSATQRLPHNLQDSVFGFFQRSGKGGSGGQAMAAAAEFFRDPGDVHFAGAKTDFDAAGRLFHEE